MTEIPTEVPAPAPASPAEPKPNGVARIFGALLSPNETFASIARRPTWVAPLLVLIVLSVASGVIMSKRLDFAAPVRDSMEARGSSMSAEQAERAERMAASFGRMASYIAPLFTVITLLIVAGVLLLAFRMFGGEGNFVQAWSATLYAFMPSVIKSLIVLAVVLATKATGIHPMAMVTIVKSNPAFLFDPKANAMAFAFAANFDLFSLWCMVLLIIGFAHLARVSKGKSAAIVISLWLVKTLFSLIGPAVASLRK